MAQHGLCCSGSRDDELDLSLASHPEAGRKLTLSESHAVSRLQLQSPSPLERVEMLILLFLAAKPSFFENLPMIPLPFHEPSSSFWPWHAPAPDPGRPAAA